MVGVWERDAVRLSIDIGGYLYLMENRMYDGFRQGWSAQHPERGLELRRCRMNQRSASPDLAERQKGGKGDIVYGKSVCTGKTNRRQVAAASERYANSIR